MRKKNTLPYTRYLYPGYESCVHSARRQGQANGIVLSRTMWTFLRIIIEPIGSGTVLAGLNRPLVFHYCWCTNFTSYCKTLKRTKQIPDTRWRIKTRANTFQRQWRPVWGITGRTCELSRQANYKISRMSNQMSQEQYITFNLLWCDYIARFRDRFR